MGVMREMCDLNSQGPTPESKRGGEERTLQKKQSVTRHHDTPAYVSRPE